MTKTAGWVLVVVLVLAHIFIVAMFFGTTANNKELIHAQEMAEVARFTTWLTLRVETMTPEKSRKELNEYFLDEEQKHRVTDKKLAKLKNRRWWE